MENIPNILATRYASDSMKAVWSAEGRITLEREYWIAVLRASGLASVELSGQLPFLGALLKKEQDIVTMADQLSGGRRYRS